MALAQIQNILARLYTDEELRKSFFLSPYDVAQKYHLNDSEIEKVIHLSQPDIESFSLSLINKRLGETRKKLLFTSKALGKKFPALFYQFARKTPLSGDKKYIQECFRFAGFVESIADKEGIDDWILDIMRYEIQMIRAVHAKFFFRIVVFRYALKDLIHDMANGKLHLKSKPKLSIGIWIKILSTKNVWHFLQCRKV